MTEDEQTNGTAETGRSGTRSKLQLIRDAFRQRESLFQVIEQETSLTMPIGATLLQTVMFAVAPKGVGAYTVADLQALYQMVGIPPTAYAAPYMEEKVLWFGVAAYDEDILRLNVDVEVADPDFIKAFGFGDGSRSVTREQQIRYMRRTAIQFYPDETYLTDFIGPDRRLSPRFRGRATYYGATTAVLAKYKALNEDAGRRRSTRSDAKVAG